LVETIAIPTVVSGLDMNALLGSLANHLREQIASTGDEVAFTDLPPIDHDVLNSLLAKLPHEPDDSLP